MKNRGWTLLELLVVIAIIAVLAGGIGANMVGKAERNAIRKTQSEIPVFIRNIIEAAYEEGRVYNLEFDSGSIRMTSSSGGKSDVYIMPRALKCKTGISIKSGSDSTATVTTKDITKINITSKGNIHEGAFSELAVPSSDELTAHIVIANKKEEVIFRVSCRTVRAVSMAKVSVFYPKTAMKTDSTDLAVLYSDSTDKWSEHSSR